MTPRPPAARRGPALVAGALSALLLLLSGRYGPHRDELYFASAARRLAWGYPDQPSLVVVLARVAQDLGGQSLTLLRLPSVLAVAAIVLMTASIARLLGGTPRAQTLAALLVGAGAVTMFLGHRLTTQTLSMAAWVAVLLIAAHALLRDRPRLWLLAGAVAGVGLNAKHDLAICLLGVLVGVCLTPSVRHHLRTPWLWLGGLVALLVWTPNLIWQARHDWPALRLAGDIRGEYGGLGGVVDYVSQALLMFSPLMAVVWILGLLGLLRRPEWSTARPLGWVFVVTFVLFLLTGGKGYYLVGAIPALLAAGSVLLVRRWPRSVPMTVVLVASAVVAWPAGLPLLPASTYAASFYTGIDDEQLETIGWPELAATVRRTLDSLPEGTVVFTGNYGEAGALEWYGVPAPVYSGHNGWGEWGSPRDGAGPVVVLGLDEASREFTGCRRVATVPQVDGADNQEQDGPVFVCLRPRQPWSIIWPKLRHLDA